MSDAETITLAVVGFFLVLALLTFARLLLRKAPPSYKRFRVGVFIERDFTREEEHDQEGNA